MAKNLTDRQKEVLNFISTYIEDNKYPPTFREIAKALDISSTKGVTDHLAVLEKKGFINRIKNNSRSIQILRLPDEVKIQLVAGRIPLVGRIAAGEPIFDEGNIDSYLDFDQAFFSRGTIFALKIKGDSMNGDHILDGDIAIIKKQDRVENGEIAAVLIEGFEEGATLKRFHKTSSRVELRPSNPAHAPIVVDAHKIRVQVLGKFVGLIRQGI
jgi:repressor LexA